MTNLPLSECRTKAGTYSFQELTEVYRKRWDIEVFFKFIKQRLGYKHLTSRSENGVRIMIIMSMISALLLVWYKHRTGINRGWRSVIFWFAEDLREWTKQPFGTWLYIIESKFSSARAVKITATKARNRPAPIITTTGLTCRFICVTHKPQSFGYFGSLLQLD